MTDTRDAIQRPIRQRVAVTGMTCAHCEVAVERRFATISGVTNIRVDHRQSSAEFDAAADIDIATLNAALAGEGYRVVEAGSDSSASARNGLRDYAEILAAFVILIGVYLALNTLNLLPNSVTVLDQMSLGFVVLIGLVASVSSCMAVTGGLLVAVAARFNDATPAATPLQRLMPHLAFNAGRILSYTLLGGAVGALGSTLTLSPAANGALTLAASAMMIVLGLQMLHLLPKASRLLPQRMSKAIAHRVHDLAQRDARGGAFVLGAATFFLPCGFTQALQLYVLAKGSFLTGALTMLAFALGTLPALLSLSAIASFARGAFQRRFVRFAGAAVIALGFLNIQYGLVLTGSGSSATEPAAAHSASTSASMSGGVQIMSMRVIDFGYEPYTFTVRQGIPVEWRVEASEAAGCGRILISPRLRIRQILSATSETVIRFTPGQAGDFAFNCGMGMMTPDAKITVVPQS